MRLRRKTSRKRRFTRLRNAAPPTRRVTVMPRRAVPAVVGVPNNVNAAQTARRPVLYTVRNCRGPVRRYARGNPWSGRRRSGGEPLPPFSTPPGEHKATSRGAHPDQEAMGLLAPAIVGLKRPLHVLDPPEDPCRREAGMLGEPEVGVKPIEHAPSERLSRRIEPRVKERRRPVTTIHTSTKKLSWYCLSRSSYDSLRGPGEGGSASQDCHVSRSVPGVGL